jgi:CheY-like chemotaxis protein
MNSSNLCTPELNIPESAGGLWSDITVASGSNWNPDDDQPSPSRSPSETPAKKRRTILVVEDNRADVFLIREALEAARIDADVQVVADGEQAMRVFQQADRDPASLCPALVLLDINLPKRQGRDVLKQLRQSVRCANASVLIVTSSDSAQDREEMTRLGAKGYFRKPSDYRDFMKLGDIVKALLDDAPPSDPS